MELRNDGMVHVLFLFPQELSANSVERVTAQFVLPLHILQYIKLQAAIQRGFLGISLSIRLGIEMSVFDDRLSI